MTLASVLALTPPFGGVTGTVPAVDPTIPTHFFGFVEALGSEPDPREAVVEAL